MPKEGSSKKVSVWEAYKDLVLVSFLAALEMRESQTSQSSVDESVAAQLLEKKVIYLECVIEGL